MPRRAFYFSLWGSVMAWIESHQELRGHPKLLKLMALLNVARPTAIGHLHLLWWWVVDYATDGDLGRYGDAEIALAADWPSDAEKFINAMTSAGFLDRDKKAVRIHDWLHFCGRLVEKRLSRKALSTAGGKARWRDKSAQNGHVEPQIALPLVDKNGPHGRTAGTKRARAGAYQPTVPNPTNRTVPTNISASAIAEKLKALWNHHCGKKLGPLLHLPKGRCDNVRVRWNERPDIQYWELVFKKIGDTFPKANMDFVPTFDWVFKNDTNHVKVSEGQYESKVRQEVDQYAHLKKY